MAYIADEDMMLGLLISKSEERDNYPPNTTTLRITVRPSLYYYEDYQLRVRNISDRSYDSRSDLADLVIEGLGWDSYDRKSVTSWDVSYRNLYEVQLKRAEIMTKRLKQIDRYLSKISAEFGEPESFGAYALRCAKALRCDTFIRQVNTESRWDHDSNEYKTMTPSAAQFHMQTIESDFYKVAS